MMLEDSDLSRSWKQQWTDGG